MFTLAKNTKEKTIQTCFHNKFSHSRFLLPYIATKNSHNLKGINYESWDAYKKTHKFPKVDTLNQKAVTNLE